jgi:hypothetical protein
MNSLTRESDSATGFASSVNFPASLGKDPNRITIELPRPSSLQGTLTLFMKLLTDGILYLAYGIAILSALKLSLHLLNGITSKPDMGSSTLDDSSFRHGEDRTPFFDEIASRRIPHLVGIAE